MSIWFFIWFLLSGALLFFLGWTLYILYKQKRGWREFASKNKLRYRTDAMMAPPDVSGTMGGYAVSLFTSEHMTADARTTRKMSAIEVELKCVMPMEGAVGSGGMVSLIQGLSFSNEFQPKHKGWDISYIVRSNNLPAMESYLSSERLDMLTSLMKIKNAWVIFIFRENKSLLRFDTPDPLDKPEKIEKIVKKLIQTARLLELVDGENSRLEAEKKKQPKERVVAVDEDKLDEEIQLELEEDEKPEVKAEPQSEKEPEENPPKEKP